MLKSSDTSSDNMCEMLPTREAENQEIWCRDFPVGTVVKNLPANAGDTGSIPGPEDPTCHGAAKSVCHDCCAYALEPACHNYCSLRA